MAPARPGGGTDPLGVVAGTVAQEIGSALTAIQVATERLERSGGGVDPASLELRVIREQSARLARLARHLLELARPPEAAGGAPAPLDLRALVGRMLPSLRRDLAQVGVELRWEMPGGAESGDAADPAARGPVVRADPLRLREVILALVANARTAALAAPAPRWIEVVVRTLPGGAGEVEVADSGPGVPEGSEERIFLPFVSGWGGAGMGLSRSRSFLAGVGGELAHRRLPDGNAAFVLTLEPSSEPPR
jgi:signal transduction histidine kinase